MFYKGTPDFSPESATMQGFKSGIVTIVETRDVTRARSPSFAMTEMLARHSRHVNGLRYDSDLNSYRSIILNPLFKPSAAVVSSGALARRDSCALRIACFFPLSS
jgi:hypothetical protein